MNYTKAYFDEYQERRGSGSTKWDGCNAKFGIDSRQEMIPMWIADMDFRSPREVIDAIVERAGFGSYGYIQRDDSFYDAILSWVKRRYRWEISRDWIVFSPGVIPGFNIAIQSLTEPGDGIIVQTPVYYPFMEAAERNGRTLVTNPLIEKDGEWFIDFEDLEEKVKQPRNKMLIFCSPHNPVGRLWKKEEISRLSKLCADHHVILISDEIHADLLMKGGEFHAVNEAAGEWKNNTITYYAPSKTFNLAGLQTAFAVIPDEKMRETYTKGLNANRIFNINWFGAAALTTAYTKCDGYVEALCDYIDANMDYMKSFLDTRLPMLKMKKPEATYMAWVDFRGTGMSTEEIERFILEKAHIGVDLGSWFGEGGEGYLRFNLACPRATLEKALDQLEKAFELQQQI
ncbi:MAG: MalY/PatB family protein [Lachnospiraceae bacterium]